MKNIREDEEAAWTIVMLSHSLPGSTKPSVVAAMERQKRVFINVPREKRTLRTPIFAYSSYSTAIVEYVPKEDHIHDGPLMKYPKTPTSNRKKRLALSFPPVEQRTKKKAKSKKTSASPPGPREPTPEWLLQLMRSKNGVEPKKIIDKALTATDVVENNGRLSIPFSQITEFEFLTPEEKTIIQEHKDKVRKKGVDAKLVSSDLREFDVNLRRWGMGNTSLYNLLTGWNKVVKDCKLKENHNIRLWSFHSNDQNQLYFALVPSDLPSGSGQSEPGTSSSA